MTDANKVAVRLCGGSQAAALERRSWQRNCRQIARTALARSLAATLVAAGLFVVGTPHTALGGETNCSRPQNGAKYLPARCSHGPLQYMRQYPVLRLATPEQRRRALSLRNRLEAEANEQGWRDLAAAVRAGYDRHVHSRRLGDKSLRYFHLEHAAEPRVHGILYVGRPKALMYAEAPGQAPTLVGAMWTTRPGEIGPTPGGPITRWHSHLMCADAQNRVTSAPSHGTCPVGMHLRLGRIEMMHVWFTRDLRSSFAMRAPEPELCAARLLPGDYCSSLGRRNAS